MDFKRHKDLHIFRTYYKIFQLVLLYYKLMDISVRNYVGYDFFLAVRAFVLFQRLCNVLHAGIQV